MDPITETQVDVGAFDGGQSYIGTEWADWVEDRGRAAMNWLGKASQDQEGIGDDILRGAGKVLQGAGAVAEAPVIKQGLQVLDAPFHYGSKLAGAAAERMGIDPRLGEWAVRTGELATGVGALKKAPKAAGRLSREAAEWGVRNAPEGSLMRLMSETGGGIVPITKKSDNYMNWRARGQAWYDANKGKKNPMTGFENFTDPATGIKYRLGSSHKGVLTNIDLDKRAVRDLKRKGTTEIPREEVEKIMAKYNQPPEMVDAFLDVQKAGKKKVDNLIKKINARIEANPEAYPGVKASLGHGRAANRYEHSADIISNLDLENFFTNVKRSNLDEVSDDFNRALGRSLDLDEEILKFIDKDLGKFFGDFGLGKNQKRGAIDFVRREMKNKHNWKSHKTKGGKQLFKSKEEYLINEALQKFGKRAATDLKINK